MSVSDHLLRTLAAVAPGVTIVDLGCADGENAEALVQLGFDMWACDPDPGAVAASRARLAEHVGEAEATRRVTVARLDALGYPGQFADWGVVTTLPDAGPERRAVLAEAHRVLRPGAWLWVQTEAPDGLVASAEASKLVVAEAPARNMDGATHAVFRRPAEIV